MNQFNRRSHLGHAILALALLLVAGAAGAQTAGTRVTPCDAATPNNALCVSWTHDGKNVDGTPASALTYRVEQKFGTGAYSTVATGLTASQYYAKNLAIGSYTIRVFANCATAGCVESNASNAPTGSATAPPVQPNAPVIIIAATIRADGPPTYRIVHSVTLRPNEVVFAAPASMRPLFASR